MIKKLLAKFPQWGVGGLGRVAIAQHGNLEGDRLHDTASIKDNCLIHPGTVQ
ncbi:MAG: hypothetical protein V7L00_29415 [Nostoc sp.]|uniref:hypothetical protein n=1 Tax=Nostoc sp. TaxID=1180 RepID=UPI002FF959CF